jgi:hypothetical protein
MKDPKLEEEIQIEMRDVAEMVVDALAQSDQLSVVSLEPEEAKAAR